MELPDKNDTCAIRLKNLPDTCGVYIMKDSDGKVIYVGKARSLKKRVSSYFQETRAENPKISYLVRNICDFEFIVTETEKEALILEFSLIKRHRPYFNVQYKDDKRYPLLEVTLDEEYPRFQIVRTKSRKRSVIFGPYTNADALRKTLDVLKKVFLIRTCKSPLKRKRPCLNYQISHCSAPCSGLIEPSEYRKLVDSAILFLEGHSTHLLKTLRKEMESEAQKLNFERSARILESIKSIESIIQKQKIIFTNSVDRDYIAFYEEGSFFCAEVLVIREGKLIDEHNFLLSTLLEMTTEEKARTFLLQYYQRGSIIPPEVFLEGELLDMEIFESVLSETGQRRVRIHTRSRGKNREMLEMARQNAYHHFKSQIIIEKKHFDAKISILEELKKVLRLNSLPLRIEAYDISNISGKYATGSMIVFSNGMPDKSGYRRFRIRGKDTPDDVHMMGEMLSRRFTIDSERGREWKKNLPDLIVLDGGKAQLGAVIRVLRELGQSIPLISLAKREEEIFLPEEESPLHLSRESPALHLLQRLRDESHRFALKYHRTLRSKGMKNGE